MQQEQTEGKPRVILERVKSPPGDEVRLAAAAISFNVRLRSSDMAVHMQEHALRCTRSFLDSSPRQLPNKTTRLARSLKKEFDLVYGPAWHCVVGTSFGSFVTHSPGGFVYFSMDSLSILLFKTQVHVVTPTRGTRGELAAPSIEGLGF